MAEAFSQRRIRWIGPALAVLALGVYLVTLAPGAFPGAPASLVVSHTGLDPFPAMSHPL